MPTAAYYIAGFVASITVLALGAWIVYWRRDTPPEKELRRRLQVNESRRTIEGFITDATAEMIHYQYELRGVTYFASQDVTTLKLLLPDDPERLVGPASIKYENTNPANSIVLCEEWSGLPAKASPAEEANQCN